MTESAVQKTSEYQNWWNAHRKSVETLVRLWMKYIDHWEATGQRSRAMATQSARALEDVFSPLLHPRVEAAGWVMRQADPTAKKQLAGLLIEPAEGRSAAKDQGHDSPERIQILVAPGFLRMALGKGDVAALFATDSADVVSEASYLGPLWQGGPINQNYTKELEGSQIRWLCATCVLPLRAGRERRKDWLTPAIELAEWLASVGHDAGFARTPIGGLCTAVCTRPLLRDWKDICDNDERIGESVWSLAQEVLALFDDLCIARNDELAAEYARCYREMGRETSGNTAARSRRETVGSDDRGTVEPGVVERLLLASPNLILEGVPGTGKTHAAKGLAGAPIARPPRFPKAKVIFGPDQAITFHPSTSYEDFVEGLRPGASRRAGGSAAIIDTATPRVVRLGLPAGMGVGPPDGGDASTRTEDWPVWFFQSTGEGPAAASAAGAGGWRVEDGFILRACAKAIADHANVYLLLLDELNRANVPKVLGDLLTTMEASKRARWVGERNGNEGASRVLEVKMGTVSAGGPDGRHVSVEDALKAGGYWDLSDCQPVTLPYSGRLFFMPDNVWLLGTMNTSDQSVAPLDAALRRRFWFHRLEPEVEEGKKDKYGLKGNSKAEAALEPTIQLMKKINDVLLEKVGPDALLGHSYLYELGSRLQSITADPVARAKAEEQPAPEDVAISQHWQYVLLPQLIAMLKATRSLHLLEKSDGSGLYSELNRALGGSEEAKAVKLVGSDLFRDAVVNLGTTSIASSLRAWAKNRKEATSADSGRDGNAAEAASGGQGADADNPTDG